MFKNGQFSVYLRLLLQVQSRRNEAGVLRVVVLQRKHLLQVFLQEQASHFLLQSIIGLVHVLLQQGGETWEEDSSQIAEPRNRL